MGSSSGGAGRQRMQQQCRVLCRSSTSSSSYSRSPGCGWTQKKKYGPAPQIQTGNHQQHIYYYYAEVCLYNRTK